MGIRLPLNAITDFFHISVVIKCRNRIKDVATTKQMARVADTNVAKGEALDRESCSDKCMLNVNDVNKYPSPSPHSNLMEMKKVQVAMP